MVSVLLTKTADTNRFIRADSNAALESVAENLSIYRAVTVLESNGACHKSIPARTTTARIIGSIVERVGGDNIMEMITPNPKEEKDKVSANLEMY